ncbi:MCE family protein, partial [bacterium]|nr:MCE family protein [bacterium]
MTKDKHSEFKIGVTVLVAAIILVLGILWGKRVDLSGGDQRVAVHFEDILGVDTGSTVLINGIKQGKVDQVELRQDGAIVTISLDEAVVLYTDAVFQITTPELMSGKVINVFPGSSGEKPSEGHIFKGMPTGDMTVVMRSAGYFIEDLREMLGALEETIYELNRTIADTTIREALIASAKNLDATSEQALNITRENRQKLSVIMDNLVASSAVLSELMEENSTQMTNTISDVGGLATSLRSSAERLDHLTAKIEAGDGALGMMINDQE